MCTYKVDASINGKCVSKNTCIDVLKEKVVLDSVQIKWCLNKIN